MEVFIIVSLILAGLLLFIVEVFLIPGISIAGIASAICLLYANYYASATLPATNKHPEKRGVITFRVCPFHFTNTACIGQYVVYPAAFKRCINLCSDLGAVYNACQHIISLSVIILFAFSIPLINLLQIISIPHCRHLPRT